MADKSFFGEYRLQSGENIFLHSDNFSVTVKREDESWQILKIKSNEFDKDIVPDFSKADFFQTGKSGKLIVSPSLPDKPLVFKGSRLHVSPGQRLSFFLKIPLSVQFYFSKSQSKNLFCELLTKRLKDTWFGEPYDGEPAFALGSDFNFSANEAEPDETEAVCPITIHNNWPLVLEVEQLIIRVENLALYRVENKFMTSQVAIEYKGKDVISSATYHYSKQIHGEKADTVLQPAISSGRNLRKINFHFIKNLYNPEE